MAERIPIPQHLGGGWVDDPGPAPMDAKAKRKRAHEFEPGNYYWRRANPNNPGGTFPRIASWDASEIEECARFARMRRDE